MRPRQEADAVPVRGLIAAFAVVIVVTIGSVFWVRFLAPAHVRGREPAPAFARPVDRTLFDEQRPFAGDRREAARRRLESYGPVAPGYVHIPIERAMELVAGGRAP